MEDSRNVENVESTDSAARNTEKFDLGRSSEMLKMVVKEVNRPRKASRG
jgi:hypothetical protein